MCRHVFTKAPYDAGEAMHADHVHERQLDAICACICHVHERRWALYGHESVVGRYAECMHALSDSHLHASQLLRGRSL